jgi:YfiH family protein
VSSRAAAAPLPVEARVGAARAWCSGRAQGNIGDHVGDDPGRVARNRAALAALVGPSEPHEWIWLRQVHGAGVHVAYADSTGTRGRGPIPEADAVVTTVRRLPLAIVTADCAPLVVASDRAIGVVHAGYRGLAAGVIEATIAQVRALGPGDIRAFLGPCIRAAEYEFGAGDLAPFVARFGKVAEARTRAGRPALDIPAVIRVVLDRVGVVEFDDCGICTAESDGYFSYRRDGDTGRQATIALLP